MESQQRTDFALEIQLLSPNTDHIPKESWLREILDEILRIADSTINDEIDFLAVAEELPIQDIIELIYDDHEKTLEIYRLINEKVDAFCAKYFKSNKFTKMVQNLTIDYDMSLIDKQMYSPIVHMRESICVQMGGRIHWQIVFSRAIDKLLLNIFIEILNRLTERAVELKEMTQTNHTSKRRYDAILELIKAHFQESIEVKGIRRSHYHDILFEVLKSRQIELSLSAFNQTSAEIEQHDIESEEFRFKILELAQTKKISNQKYAHEGIEISIETVSNEVEDDQSDTSRLCFGSIGLKPSLIKKINEQLKMQFLVCAYDALKGIEDDDGTDEIDNEYLDKVKQFTGNAEKILEFKVSISELGANRFEFVYNAVTGELEFPSMRTNLMDLKIISEANYAFIKRLVTAAISTNLESSQILKQSPSATNKMVQARVTELLTLSLINSRQSALDSEDIPPQEEIIIDSFPTIEVYQGYQKPTAPNIAEEKDEDLSNAKNKGIRIPRGITGYRIHSFLERFIGPPTRKTGKHQIYQRKDMQTGQYYGPICPVPYHGSSKSIGIGIIANILEILQIPKDTFINEI